MCVRRAYLSGRKYMVVTPVTSAGLAARGKEEGAKSEQQVTLSTGVDCGVLDGRLVNEKNADPRVLKKFVAVHISERANVYSATTDSVQFSRSQTPQPRRAIKMAAVGGFSQDHFCRRPKKKIS
ncbi:hypothetical protein CBL_12769 [Carabus blaptoides fortunei]